jgi:4-hydroxy-tetrahydrodipicolinate synthase
MKSLVERCHGAIADLPTPYRTGRLDLPALETLCHRLIDRGISALAPCGTSGETSLLTADEHHRVVATTAAAAAGRVPVIAGAASNNTQTAVELARSAERAGASALLCVTPFHLKPSQAGMMMHLRAIHDAVGIPIILSDEPLRSAVALDDVTVARLAELPRIVGLKDAAGDTPRVGRLRRRLGKNFLLLSGGDANQAAFRTAGGDGCISVTANVVPALCMGLHHACNERMDGDVQWYEQILAPLHQALFLEANPIPLKRALSRLGVMGDGPRLRLPPLSPEAGRKLEHVLQAILPLEDKEAERHAAARPHLTPHAA